MSACDDDDDDGDDNNHHDSRFPAPVYATTRSTSVSVNEVTMFFRTIFIPVFFLFFYFWCIFIETKNIEMK